ncbi:serine aminopeptidase domain-containing protein [Venatoribacter cucullus]|uniref:alpha/beta hydrolase family protein n=1 Tax=Venatoribacter cucullus TaxID=2661630 RepID=UPI00223E917C|nr:alpha/beta hydrolase [Venatoribacter cucullus]UZK03034.1 alpha/beta hydrolase [Venatoribacter cucullus]
MTASIHPNASENLASAGQNTLPAGETIRIRTKNGAELAAKVFEPQGAAKGVCIIAPATGVAHYLYDDFARWLAGQGYVALSFDYEGMGDSVRGHLKYCKSDKLSWASNDCPAVLAYVKERFAGLERIWIGHSVGGHMIGFMGHNPDIDRIITVGSGVGTWWYNSAPTKRVAWFLWYFLVPAVVPMAGYFPGKKLGIMTDMPKGVILQWRRWCLKKEYAVGAEGDWLRQRFASVKTPITSVEFSDDEMMSARSVAILHGFFTGAPKRHVRVTPQDIGQKRIGHIGWHRQRYAALWEQVFAPVLKGEG